MRQRPTPKRSTGSRNTPARQASLQKLTKGTTDTISSLRKAMGFTPQAGSATPAKQAGSATPAKQAGSATPAPSVQVGRGGGGGRPMPPKAGQQAQPIPFGKQGRRSGGMKKR